MAFHVGASILHATAAAIMAYGFQSLEGLAADAWIRAQKGGHFQYLTIQGLTVAWLTMVVSLVLDLFPSFPVLPKIKRGLFMVALPLAVVISSIYWTLILFLPSLILLRDPTDSEPSSSPESPPLLRIPLSVDLALHATPAVALLIDFMFFERKYTAREVSYAPFIVAAAAVWYGWWVEQCAAINGHFPYPFLEAPLEIRLAIYFGASVIGLVSFWGLNAIHPRA